MPYYRITGKAVEVVEEEVEAKNKKDALLKVKQVIIADYFDDVEVKKISKKEYYGEDIHDINRK